MIFGIGTDIVSIERIENIVRKYGDRFAKRILSDSEYEEYTETGNKVSFLAKRFAAKEAFSKALGSGLIAPVKLRSIIISHTNAGKPEIEPASDIANIISAKGILSCHLSLSDEQQYALAFVILEK